MSLKKDHLTILNPASVSGIDHVRVLPPPSARIQVHPRVIHSITNNTLPVPNSSCLDWERWCCTKFVVYKNNAMNGQGSYDLKFYIALINITQKTQTVADGNFVDCKTVRIFLSPQGSRTSRTQDSFSVLYWFLYWFWEIKNPTVLQSSNFGTFQVWELFFWHTNSQKCPSRQLN